MAHKRPHSMRGLAEAVVGSSGSPHHRQGGGLRSYVSAPLPGRDRVVEYAVPDWVAAAQRFASSARLPQRRREDAPLGMLRGRTAPVAVLVVVEVVDIRRTSNRKVTHHTRSTRGRVKHFAAPTLHGCGRILYPDPSATVWAEVPTGDMP